jgi:hypothetical protein
MTESLVSCVPLHTISEIANDKGARALSTQAAIKAPPERCLSFTTRTGIELDLEAGSKEEAEAWLSTVYRILTSAGAKSQQDAAVAAMSAAQQAPMSPRSPMAKPLSVTNSPGIVPVSTTTQPEPASLALALPGGAGTAGISNSINEPPSPTTPPIPVFHPSLPPPHMQPHGHGAPVRHVGPSPLSPGTPSTPFGHGFAMDSTPSNNKKTVGFTDEASSSTPISVAATGGVTSPTPGSAGPIRHNKKPSKNTIRRTLNLVDPTELFVIVSKLGEGSYGSVFKALDTRDGKAVAIKVLPGHGKLSSPIHWVDVSSPHTLVCLLCEHQQVLIHYHYKKKLISWNNVTVILLLVIVEPSKKMITFG